MTKPQVITVRLTEPQYLAIQGSLGLYIQTMADNGDAYSATQAQVAERAADAVRTAWRRAEAGF